MTLPRTPEEASRYISEKLNWFEKLFDDATGFDERQDLTNRLLMEILKISGGAQPAPPPYPQIPRIIEFDLSDERSAPGEPFSVIGNTITAITNGSLEGIGVRLDAPGNDLVLFSECNPYPYLPGFTGIYLQNTAQAGKTLKLYIGTAGATASVELTSVTFAINVTAGEIMLPIDIQSSYIMMPVDLQAQYITLDINIESVTEGVVINIGSVEGTVDINIATQAANINIDIETQSVGIYMQPEWAALQGTDKNWFTTGATKNWQDNVGIDYEVDGDKTLFICGISCCLYTEAEKDAGLPLYFDMRLFDFTIPQYLAALGGLGGGGLVFPKPIVVPGGHEARLRVFNESKPTVGMHLSMWGYEI